MRSQSKTVEKRIAQIAHPQHGVITRDQLLEAGLSASGIQRRVQEGALFREHPAVYRVGHRAPNVEARYFAAVCASGSAALLRGLAAGHLLELIEGPPPEPEVMTTTERRIPGITTRRTRRIDARDATSVRRIPVTTVARTLVDLAAVLPPKELARAWHEAGVRYGTTPSKVEAVLTRRPNSRGAGKLRAVLRGDTKVALSKLEQCFLELLQDHGFPLPEMNRAVGKRIVDCRWPAQQLTVELDGYHYHRSSHAWEKDHRREREARARGDDFRRYTFGDVMQDPRSMLRELKTILPRRPA